jgi:hypothetical protein
MWVLFGFFLFRALRTRSLHYFFVLSERSVAVFSERIGSIFGRVAFALVAVWAGDSANRFTGELFLLGVCSAQRTRAMPGALSGI